MTQATTGDCMFARNKKKMRNRLLFLEIGVDREVNCIIFLHDYVLILELLYYTSKWQKYEQFKNIPHPGVG